MPNIDTSHPWFVQKDTTRSAILYGTDHFSQGPVTHEPFPSVMAAYKEAGIPVVKIAERGGARFGIVPGEIEKVRDATNANGPRITVAFKSTRFGGVAHSSIDHAKRLLAKAGYTIAPIPDDPKAFRVELRPKNHGHG